MRRLLHEFLGAVSVGIFVIPTIHCPEGLIGTLSIGLESYKVPLLLLCSRWGLSSYFILCSLSLHFLSLMQGYFKLLT